MEVKENETGAVVECWYTPTELLQFFQSIDGIRYDGTEVEIHFRGDSTWIVASEHWYGSLTQQFICLLDGHLSREKVFIGIEEDELDSVDPSLLYSWTSED